MKKFEPTKKQRELVEQLTGFGLTETMLAKQLGIDAKTLRKYFREELDAGIASTNAQVVASLFYQATKLNIPSATIFWCKARLGWKETTTVEHAGEVLYNAQISTKPLTEEEWEKQANESPEFTR